MIDNSSNYYIPIYMNSSSNKIKYLLWIFDSGDVNCYGKLGWGCISKNSIKWYKNTSKLFPDIKGMAFFHISLPEVSNMTNTQ